MPRYALTVYLYIQVDMEARQSDFIYLMWVFFKVEWLQQQVVQTRVKRNLRVSHIVPTDTKTKHLPTADPRSSRTWTLHYNDSVWNSLWYIVSQIWFSFSELKYKTQTNPGKQSLK